MITLDGIQIYCMTTDYWRKHVFGDLITAHGIQIYHKVSVRNGDMPLETFVAPSLNVSVTICWTFYHESEILCLSLKRIYRFENTGISGPKIVFHLALWF